MKNFFLIIVLVHGLIHLFGFIKAFGIKEFNELTLPISISAGYFWLTTALLFIIYGILHLINLRYSFFIGFVAVIASQILIFYYWKDAKFGTIANLMVIVACFVSFGSYVLNHEFTSVVKHDFSENTPLSTEILTEEDIAHLPLAVQEYLRYTKSVGQPKVKNFKAEFVGIMQSNKDDKGMKAQSVQYNFYQKPSRYFYMEATKMGLPATALHIYHNETATFSVKLLNWFKVVNAKGDEMNQGETVTLFNDMCLLAPATLIDPEIQWETINDSTIKAQYTNGSIIISAELYFNEKHELVNFISKDRFDTDGKEYRSYPWLTPVENYKMFNGYLLPGRGKAIYQKPEGDFTYLELEIKSVKYNLSGMEE